MVRSKWFKALLLLISIGLLCFAFKTSILKAVGNYLIDEDQLKKAKVLFVLGGGSFDRGNEAARLMQEGYAEKVIPTGGNLSSLMLIFEKDYKESELAAINLKRNGVPEEKIEVLPEGTSTKEEAAAVINYCLNNKIDRAIVLSDKFHTKRVRKVFQPLFEENNVSLILVGSPSSNYKEEEWWKYEQGLIMVNNEYIKHLYYFLKY